ncbi:YfbU family protein (plasmid) [Glutamicibacter bergerei]
MATITVRIDDSVRDALQAKAAEGRQTLSDFVRDRLQDSVFTYREGNESNRDVGPDTLSALDRHKLALLHRILGRVLPEDAGDVDGDKKYQLERAEVLEQGFTKEYSTEFYGIRDELSAHHCDFVMDVLDMFRIALYSIAELQQNGVVIEESIQRALKFNGFDHNDQFESQMSDYANFLVSAGKWREQEDFILGPEKGNSHYQAMPVYSRMLTEYREVKQHRTRKSGLKSYLLDENELKQIAGAAVHPSNR